MPGRRAGSPRTALWPPPPRSSTKIGYSPAEAAELIRTLVDKITLTPDEGEDRLVADLHGELAGIIALAASRKHLESMDEAALQRHMETFAAERRAFETAEDAYKNKLVAGVGFEPTTFRL